MQRFKQGALFQKKITESFHEEFGTDTKEYDEIIKKWSTNHVKYIDNSFPAAQFSLAKNWSQLSENYQNKWKNFEWKTPDKIFQIYNEDQLFQGSIEPNDIKQGLLGDCYFLSALSVLAEKPQLVTQLFHSQQVHPSGAFSVWLNRDGEWVNFILDDMFPCYNNKPAFSRSHGHKLWVMVLEKAYAKMYGSYACIDGGNPAIALRDLTGAPYENKDDGTADELWEYLWDNFQKKFLLTCYSMNAQDDEEQKMGILPGHAYAILHLAKVIDSFGIPQKILQVRNPWGKVEWNGDWSDESPLWTSRLKVELQLQDKNDGIFWINHQDFRKYYQGVGICKIHDTYFYNNIKSSFQDDFQKVFHIDATDTSHTYISVNQNDERFFIESMQDYKYSFLRIILCQILSDGTLKYIDGIFKQDRNTQIEVNLDPGHYILLVDIDWQFKKINCKTVTISTYSQKKVGLKAFCGIDALQVQQHCFKDFALEYPGKILSYEKQYNLNIEKRTGAALGILYFYYSNKTTDHVLMETITFNTLMGFRPLQPFNKSFKDSLNFQVEPGKELIILFTQYITDNGECSYSFKTQSKVFEQEKKQTVQNPYYLQELNFSNAFVLSKTGFQLNLTLAHINQTGRVQKNKNSKKLKPHHNNIHNIELTTRLRSGSEYHQFDSIQLEVLEKTRITFTPIIYFILIISGILSLLLSFIKSPIIQLTSLLLMLILQNQDKIIKQQIQCLLLILIIDLCYITFDIFSDSNTEAQFIYFTLISNEEQFKNGINSFIFIILILNLISQTLLTWFVVSILQNTRLVLE